MIDPDSIKKDMPVIGSDGETLGQVDGVEGGAGADGDARIKLKRVGSPDGQHHHVPLSDVARVDEHVHLNRTAAAVRAGFLTSGAAAGVVAAAPPVTSTHHEQVVHGARDVRVEDKSGHWIPWILGSLALLALLMLGLRSCNRTEPVAVVPVDTNVTTTVPAENVAVAVAEESVPLPGGQTLMLAPRTIGYDLQRYLASNAPAPRTFQFERLNFDTARSDIRAVDKPTVDGIAKILAAYPASRVRLIGYADARGAADANANLGAARAQAVASALTSGGVPADRIETASGGETGATDTNATAQGQFENRRTELVVLVK